MRLPHKKNNLFTFLISVNEYSLQNADLAKSRTFSHNIDVYVFKMATAMKSVIAAAVLAFYFVSVETTPRYKLCADDKCNCK